MMNGRSQVFLTFLLTTAGAFAQTAPSQPVVPSIEDTVIVTGTTDPLPLKEVDRTVVVLPIAGREILTPTLNDALREDSSIDIRQRGAGGAQADLSIRGATFAQSLVLLNGL